MNSKKAKENIDDQKLKLLAFKVCHVAVWADAKMTADERRLLSHLTEAMCRSQAERKVFREIQLQEISEDLLLSEIEPLTQEEKAYVFETCLEALASDKMINLLELKFLATLRKVCGVGYRSYRKRLAKVRRRTRAKIYSRKLALLFIAVYLIAGGTVAYVKWRLGSSNIDLHEACSGKGISVSIISPNSPPIEQLPTTQAVFDRVRDSIVSVRVFVNYDPICRGSGSVIGSDETGMLYVITNRHVIKNSSIEKRGEEGGRLRIEVQQPSGAKFDAVLDFYSREHDLAFLSVKGMNAYAKPLRVNLKSGLLVGQSIYAVGSPIGLDHSFTAGVVSALRETYLQTDATIHSGSSGGPLIDQYGSLCGIVTKGHVVKDYGFALYSDAVLDMLKERQELMIDASSE